MGLQFVIASFAFKDWEFGLRLTWEATIGNLQNCSSDV